MKLNSERDASEWLWNAKALAVVSAWSELGLLDRLAAGPVGTEDLGLDERALATTLPVLLHLGLLASDGRALKLTSTGARLHREGALPSGRNLEWLADLRQMTDILKHGGPVRDAEGNSKATQGGTRADDLDHTERFLDMLYRQSDGAASSVFEWLSTRIPAGGSVLDLGGGHGRYARTFADAGFAATLFDLPHVVGLARKRHGDALRYIEGDFHTQRELGGPYDLILLSNIVHGESPSANAALVAAASKHLKPGGLLAIKDMFLDELGRGPENAVFFGLTMLFYTTDGRSPSLADAHDWFEAAGLESTKVTLLDTHALAVGKKK
jgi:SAM-dependent methyltransferase